jgi:hypothetical protein
LLRLLLWLAVGEALWGGLWCQGLLAGLHLGT